MCEVSRRTWRRPRGTERNGFAPAPAPTENSSRLNRPRRSVRRARDMRNFRIQTRISRNIESIEMHKLRFEPAWSRCERRNLRDRGGRDQPSGMTFPTNHDLVPRRKPPSPNAARNEARHTNAKSATQTPNPAHASQREHRCDQRNQTDPFRPAVSNRRCHRKEEGKWCGREDSNFHGLPHSDLNAARLPIPPRPHRGRVDLRRRGCM